MVGALIRPSLLIVEMHRNSGNEIRLRRDLIILVQCRVTNDFHQRERKIVNKTGNAYISGVTKDSVENSTKTNVFRPLKLYYSTFKRLCQRSINGNSNMAHKLRSNNGATCICPRVMSHFRQKNFDLCWTDIGKLRYLHKASIWYRKISSVLLGVITV